MKVRLELWVRLKVVDLVAQTAWLTLTEKLDFGSDLCGLIRYAYWGMVAEGPEQRTVIEDVDRVVRIDSAFTNQNKHLYKLLCAGAALPEVQGHASVASYVARSADRSRGDAPPVPARGDLMLEKDYPVGGDGCASGSIVFAIDCLIREKNTDRERGYLDRLNRRLDTVAVRELWAGDVWRMLICAGDGDTARRKADRILVTRSRREGLMLNPHYQRYEVISTTALGRKGGES